MEIPNMSIDGTNILKMVQQTRNFCDQIATLLKTANVQMKKHSWESMNTAITETSQSINYPTQWIATAAFQFYKNKNYPNRLLYISVIFDNDVDEEYTIEEPIVTAGSLDYGNGQVEENLGNEVWWYSRLYGYLQKYPDQKNGDDGYSFDKKTARLLDPQGHFESGELFAVPLVLLRNDKDIKMKITDRLLGLLPE
jgi:hypothetical protein